MLNALPVKVLAQINEVTVLQTAAHSDGTTFTDSQEAINSHQANYGAFNLGLHVNDHAARVLTNRMRVLGAINQHFIGSSTAGTSLTGTSVHTPVSRLHWVNQVHGNHVYDVDTARLTLQPKDADAMVARQARQGLAIMTADCVPIVLYQPATGQIAAIHAGWQGLACGVIGAAIARFTTGTDAAPIMAWMGVCISQANYEVNKATADKLMAGCAKNNLLAMPYITRFEALYTQYGADDKVLLNLPTLAAHQLLSAGVTLETTLPVPCSYEDKRYYSYRRQTHLQQPATGRMALVIVRRL